MNFYLEALQEEHLLLEGALESYRAPIKRIAGKIRARFKSGKAQKIIFAGMGSSWYAARSVQKRLNQEGYFSIAVNCFEMGTMAPETDESGVWIFLSQSGNTPEVADLLKHIKNHCAMTVAVLNEEECRIKGLAGEEIYLKVGHETPVSNKTYYAQVALLNLLAEEIVTGDASGVEEEIRRAINWHQGYCGHQKENTEKLIHFLNGTEFLELLGDGAQGGAAQQAGLVLREMTGLRAAYYSSSDFSHGWFDMAEKGYTAVFLCHEISVLDRKTMEYCLEHGAKVLLISNEKTGRKHENLMEVLLPESGEGILPLYSIVPLYFIAGILPEGKVTE